MRNKWVVRVLVGAIFAILLFLFSKPILFSITFLVIEWFWPRIRAKLSLYPLNFIYLDIEFLTFGTIILGYFYGPFFGVFVPLTMAILEAAYLFRIGWGFDYVGKQIGIHILIGLLAAIFSTAPFATVAISLLVVRYGLDIGIDFLRGFFMFPTFPSAVLNFIIFVFLFGNYSEEIVAIFSK
ncbi:hypothetical protein GOV08_02595 [Candidatus Woesearchaeota archaeon]|nr:hypothetical protein [Candidatus Woesearchaeota archaeon]